MITIPFIDVIVKICNVAAVHPVASNLPSAKMYMGVSVMKQMLDFYARQSTMTTPGTHKDLLIELPNEIGSLVRIVQGLGIYDEVAKEFYDFTVPKRAKPRNPYSPHYTNAYGNPLAGGSPAHQKPTSRKTAREPL